MDRLLLYLADDLLQATPFDGRPVEVGRSRGNDVVVPDPAVADFHLVVRRGADGPVAIDRTGLGIPDGNRRPERLPLRPGLRIPLGRFAIELAEDGHAPVEVRETLVVEEPAARPALPTLSLHLVSDPTRTFPVRPTETHVGAAPDNHVVLDDRFVSAKHCRIRAEGSSFVVRDVESRNGTWVNGIRVCAAEIHAGTRIRVGRTELVCRSREMPEDLGIVGVSEALRAVRADVARVAPLSGSVLVGGESGSGKEIVARALHGASGRSGGAFVALNCAALSPALVESELFGHERGAFTDAASRRRGAFEIAHGGTLFLDEVGDLPMAQQGKLLRALEEKAIRRIGGEAWVHVDARVVAASHRDLHGAMLDGKFREDLYHRLAVFRISVPPLRDRPEDVTPLAEHFLEAFADELGVHRLSPAAQSLLRRYPWPGNVRELRNVLYRAAARTAGVVVEADDLQLEHWFPARLSAPPSQQDPERERLRRVLARNGGVIARAARELGIARETLRDRLRNASRRSR